MRKIEQAMNGAIALGINWASGNTTVTTDGEGISRVYLHGNHIATVDQDTRKVIVNARTLADYPTMTTKSRLRALGCRVSTRKGVTYLNDVSIEEAL